MSLKKPEQSQSVCQEQNLSGVMTKKDNKESNATEIEKINSLNQFREKYFSTKLKE